VGVASYVCDFAYLPARDCAVLIEISPFRTCTGAALFSWSNDAHALRHGPLEFRTLERPRDEAALGELVAANWECRWECDVPHFAEWYARANDADAPVALQTATMATALSPAAVAGLSVVCAGASWLRDWRTAIAMGATVAGLVWYARSRRAALSPPPPAPPPAQAILFCYGTLKRGFHWHQKYLGRARFLSAATTQARVPLCVGESGVPYVLGDRFGVDGHRIRGELFAVDATELAHLDEYEGCAKGYYSRRTVAVRPDDDAACAVREAEMYVLNASTEQVHGHGIAYW
jgi:gamma-glutamylcyclotransferase (GGCT)/AIG2-like uncharacterized protein YtfP